jgi:hypothetical protein
VNEREVYSQSALRDLIDRAHERLQAAIAKPDPDPVLVQIANARTVDELRGLWWENGPPWSHEIVVHARGRRAVLELPPKEY